MNAWPAVAALVSVAALVNHGYAAPFKQAQIKNIIQGKEVFINNSPAKINQLATNGQTLSTGSSRTELLFDQSAIGLLGRSSTITLGPSCYRLHSGKILINGGQSACLGSKLIGIRGTTYVVSAMADDTYTISVLHGEAVIGSEGDIPKQDVNILAMYPKVNNILSVNASAYANNAGDKALGSASGLILGGLDAFIPISQGQAKNIFYSNNFANTNFDGFWGVSSELGYTWFDPGSGSISKAFVGYDGFEQPGCYHSQISLGADYEFKSRWKVGANGGLKVDNCPSSSSYGIIQVSAPIAQIGDNSVSLGVGPYIVVGLGNDFAGGRASLEVPVSNSTSISAYGQYDGLYQTTVGGMISYRFGIGSGGKLIRDPNSKNIKQDASSADENNSLITVAAGEEVVLSSQGAVISRSKMSQENFVSLVTSLIEGQDPLPEGVAIYNTYKSLYGKSNYDVMSATGAYALSRFSRPYTRLRGADNLFIPNNRIPVTNTQGAPRVNEADNTPTSVFVFGEQ
jgi:hypothetical protein